MSQVLDASSVSAVGVNVAVQVISSLEVRVVKVPEGQLTSALAKAVTASENTIVKVTVCDFRIVMSSNAMLPIVFAEVSRVYA
jgi:hypothetical protein